MAVAALTARDEARYWSKSRFLPPLTAFDTFVRGLPSVYCHNVWHGNTRIVGLSGGEKKFENMFILFDRIHDRDGRRDGQTPHDGIDALLHSIARQKYDVERRRELKTVNRY